MRHLWERSSRASASAHLIGDVSLSQQLHWIEARDAVGEIIDRYLAADPEPPERLAIALVEDGLRAGDRAVGLL